MMRRVARVTPPARQAPPIDTACRGTPQGTSPTTPTAAPIATRPITSTPWLTLPNALSVSRVLLAPLCAALYATDHALLAAVVFYGAVVTDFMDGRIARRRDQVTALGGLLDHASDAVFVTVQLAALAWSGTVPVLLPVMVLAAFTQYMLDSRALSGRILRASWLGRRNGVLYFVPAGTAITRDALQLSWPADAWLIAFGWLLVATTLLSMLDRALTLVRRN